jgi:2-dehydropantoate 2-reductase
MKICIFGAGGIGGYLAVELSLAGHDVCAIARGVHLQAIQQHGLKLLTGGRSKVAMIAASDNPSHFGPQDLSSARSRRIRPTRAQKNSLRC